MEFFRHFNQSSFARLFPSLTSDTTMVLNNINNNDSKIGYLGSLTPIISLSFVLGVEG